MEGGESLTAAIRRLLDGGFQIGCEVQTTGMCVLGYQLFEAWFIDGDDSVGETRNLFPVHINARHINAEFRKASSGHKSDVTRANYRNMHFVIVNRLFVNRES